MPQSNTLAQEKAELRARLKRLRSAIPTEQRKAFSRRIAEQVLALDEVQVAKVVFIYISYASEVDTHDLIDTLLQQGKTLVVPKILSKDKMLAAPFAGWDELKPAELGILSPVTTTPLKATFDVAITPGLGFTESGKRIGFGAGYYDRWFANNKVDRKIALAFEGQLVDDIPSDEYDQPVDLIVTETRVINCS